MVVTGYTLGDWNVSNDGWNDVAAVKLNADNGEVIWSYQVGRFPGRCFEVMTSSSGTYMNEL